MQLNSFLYASLLVCAKKGNKTSHNVKMHDEIIFRISEDIYDLKQFKAK